MGSRSGNTSRLVGAVWAVALAIAAAGASGEAHAVEGNRASHRFGVFLGVDNPYPTLVGGNVGFHLFDWLRASGGYGKIEATLFGNTISASTLGGLVNVFVPGWGFSPTAGLGYSKVDATITGTASANLDVAGFRGSGSHVFMSVGLDWVAQNGFYVATGVHVSTKADVDALPYFNIGWFF